MTSPKPNYATSVKLPGVFSRVLIWLCAAAFFVACGALAIAESPTKKAQGIDALVALEYKREVLGYCGLSDPLAVQGFLDRKQKLIRQHELGKEDLLQAASDARQAAYAEWQNRGLGGFRGWCRNEGSDYTSVLKTYIDSD